METTCSRLALVISATLIAGCVSGADRDVSRAPTNLADGWSVAAPASSDVDVALLDSMIRQIEAGEYVNIDSVLIVKDDALVLEQYFNGNKHNTLHEIRSATKSIGSMLVGIAIDRGLVPSEHAPIHSFFEGDYEPAEGWTDQAKQVEIRHLLSMMSGYDCDDLATDFGCENAMYRTDDWVRYALDLPFAHPPGEHWAYNSSSLILPGEAVARSSGLKVDAFAERYLFGPLGIERFRWQFSPQGRAWIGGGARMTPREMAKIGRLMLDRGVWSGERLLSKEWIERSTTRQGEMLGGVDYGYLWQRGQCYIGAELVSAFWASGNGGQYIIVLPDDRMVVVFTGSNYDSPLADQPFRMLRTHVLPAFRRPAPLDRVALETAELERLAGVYRLDFEPSATSTISVHDGRIRLLSPDGESIDMVAHSSTFFSGDSQYGPLTVVFEADEQGRVLRHTIYGTFQTFVFERRP